MSNPRLYDRYRGVSATSGHLASNGGIRGHSAGNVFPYVIAIQNDKFHVIGQGLKFGDSAHDDYTAAENAALQLLTK